MTYFPEPGIQTVGGVAPNAQGNVPLSAASLTKNVAGATVVGLASGAQNVPFGELLLAAIASPNSVAYRDAAGRLTAAQAAGVGNVLVYGGVTTASPGNAGTMQQGQPATDIDTLLASLRTAGIIRT